MTKVKDTAIVIDIDGVKYIALEWAYVKNNGEAAKLVGEFVHPGPTRAQDEWCSQLFISHEGYHVYPMTAATYLRLQECVDYKRVKQLSTQLRGVVERFVERDLAQEFKEILKRSPDTANSMVELIAAGAKSVLEQISKGK